MTPWTGLPPSMRLSELAHELDTNDERPVRYTSDDVARILRRIAVTARGVELEAQRRSRFMSALRWAVGLE